ncbi:MAG: chloride channel protein [Desulfuromonadaceae bacterium]|nr:chloride channel protein [Desulfuromonadaceae bacterium]
MKTCFSASVFPHFDFRAMRRPLLLSILVGFVSGLGAVVFYYCANAVDAFFLKGMGGFHPPEEGAPISHFGAGIINSLHMEHSWFLFLVPVIGGLVSGFLVYKFAPEAEGHGTDAAIDAFHNKGGYIRGRVPFIKAFASIATIGTGGSAGREGPIAHIGASFGSFLSSKLKLTSAERRILLLAGMAGGIGATFRAPLGGALFAVEVLYRKSEFEHEGLIPCIISSIVAYSLFGAVTGWQPLLATPRFSFDHPPELLLFLALGVLCALFGKAYVKFFYGMRDLFKRIPLDPCYRPALGGLLLGILALFIPQVLGSGYGMVQAALYGKVAIWIMIVVAVAKILATSLTISSGGSGGVFAPSLVIGAMLGGAFGASADLFFPVLVDDPRAYVLIGMAGFFSGVSKTPIATLIMVSELTGNYGLLAPLMLVCVIAMIIFPKNSIYAKQVDSRLDSPAHLGDFVIDVLEGIRIRDLAEHGRKPTFIPEHLPLPEVMKRIAQADGAYYLTVNAENQMTGIFSINDIRRILHEDIPPGLILARDIATAQIVSCTPNETLSEALRKFTSRGLEEIPVVADDDAQKVLFMLSRRVLLAQYATKLEQTKGAYAVD